MQFNCFVFYFQIIFKYPSREKIVLNKISFKINAGEKIAFVGPSGCGKSTIL